MRHAFSALAHRLQAMALGSSWYSPGGHRSQDAAPPNGWMLPGAHGEPQRMALRPYAFVFQREKNPMLNDAKAL